jgi:adenylate cyclase
MSSQTTVNSTVVFADLMGSTGLYEATGNASAARAVTQLTDWISDIIVANDGRVVKTLGDGVLAIFAESANAIEAVVEMQRRHQKHMGSEKEVMRLPIRVGIACGEIEIVQGDCFGDAVNVAARLSDLSGGHQIWATDQVLANISEGPGVRFRPLGPIIVRGRNEPLSVYQVDWKVEDNSDMLTMQADFDTIMPNSSQFALGKQIKVSWLDQVKVFRSFDLPVRIGRSVGVEFVVNDPRVSREHSRLEWRNGGIVLVDVSSYGTWLRFAGANTEQLLRREECVLHGTGEIAMGAPFTDLTVPTVTFLVS